MSNDVHKVIAFPLGGKSSKATEIAQHTAGASMRAVEKSGMQLYWENVIPAHEHLGDFLDVLLATNFVTLFMEGADIRKYSKLRVSIRQGNPIVVNAIDFLKLTCRDWREVEDIGQHIVSWLEGNSIRISCIEGDTSHDERTITSEDRDTYRVESIQSRMGGIYSVELYLWDGIVVGNADDSNFGDEVTVTLLDIIACAFDDIETFNGLSCEGVHMDVTFVESEDTGSTTHIDAELVMDIVYDSLLRINPTLYASMTPDEARRHYFHNNVMAKLSGDKMN